MSELEKLVLFAVFVSSPATLSEIVPAFLKVYPGTEPSSIHDALNDLIVLGSIVLRPDGKYARP